MLPDFSAERRDALSGTEIPSVLGGVSPEHLNGLVHTHFIVVPTTSVKYYNRDGLGNILGRYAAVEMADGEAWVSPSSFVFRITCDEPTFRTAILEFKKICAQFGANEIRHYLTTEPELL